MVVHTWASGFVDFQMSENGIAAMGKQKPPAE
jgi:hypothetical protein